MDYPTVSTLA
jgi:hypothetical protein